MSGAKPRSNGSGYKQPPRASRFAKGTSGNPRGRPRGRRRSLPHDHVLGQMVTVRDQGKTRRVTAAEAFLLYLLREGLAGDARAARDALAAMEIARSRRPVTTAKSTLIFEFVSMGIEGPLDALRLAAKKYPYDENRVRWEMNPWIVEAALVRLGDREFDAEEQRKVWRATRTPHKVTWPEWWSERG